ncbi:MAG: rod shape-determining protein MreD [Candidatus Aminicenantales bacterium]
MKDFFEILIAVIFAFLFYTVLKFISISIVQLFNIFSLVVIYFALTKGEIVGASLGAGCGLIQDALSLGVFGVAGISKTIIGFAAGYISRRINVLPVIRNFIFLFILLSIDFILWSFLSSLIFSEKLLIGHHLQFLQPLLTAALGALIFFILGRFHKFPS